MNEPGCDELYYRKYIFPSNAIIVPLLHCSLQQRQLDKTQKAAGCLNKLEGTVLISFERKKIEREGEKERKKERVPD